MVLDSTFVLDPLLMLNLSPFLFCVSVLYFFINSMTRALCTLLTLVVTLHFLFTQTSVLFDSYRIGNEIDMWFADIVIPQRRLYVSYTCAAFQAPLPKQHKHSFVDYLRNHPLKDPSDTFRSSELATTRLVDEHVSQCWGHQVWLLYSYDTIKPLVSVMRDNLNVAMRDYFGNKLQSLRIPKRVVVHFRVGDFLISSGELGHVVMTACHVISAVLTLPFNASSFLLLNGGVTHGCGKNTSRDARLRQRSEVIINSLAVALNHLAPVQMSLNTSDIDFATMAIADGLIVGIGSFALAGAVANVNGHIRSPAIEYLNPVDKPQLHKRQPELITSRWMTYDAHSRTHRLPAYETTTHSKCFAHVGKI